MKTPPLPPLLRRRLGGRLKAMRESAGFSLDQAAKRLDKTRTSLFRIESGETKADVHLIRSMMDLYDRYEGGLLDQARKASKTTWSAPDKAGLGYIDAETHASTVYDFSGLTVPGLLQTEGYVRALFAGSTRQRSRRQIETDVTDRLLRQQRLTCEDNPLELVAVIDEAALRREVGGPQVMREQLRHIAKSATLPTVSVYGLPFRGGVHCSMDGGFTLLEFPEPPEPELLYLECAFEVLHIEDPDKLRGARLKFDQLRKEARGATESIELIERIAAHLDRQDDHPV